MATTVAVLGLVLGAVGAGVSYSASMSAAKDQSTFASLNAMSGLQQTRLQGESAALQAQMRQANAEAQQRSANNNATSMREQADAENRIAQENIRKGRIQFQHLLGQQRANRASSGVVDTTGSPLDILVSASEDQAQLETEQRWGAENQRRKGWRQAQIEQNQGNAFGVNAGLYALEGMAARADAAARGTQVRLNEFSQLASARGAAMSATGGAISAAGGLANGYYDYTRYRTMRAG